MILADWREAASCLLRVAVPSAQELFELFWWILGALLSTLE